MEVTKKDELNPEYFTKEEDLRMVMMTCGGLLNKSGGGYIFDSNVVLKLVPATQGV